MRAIFKTVALAVVSFGFVSCAQTEARTPTPVKVSPVGMRFEASGRVTMHQGQPCAPQVMFNLQPRDSKSPVWLAARLNESKVLTDAARHGRRVHVSGVWRHGRETGCRYIEVTKATRE